MTTAFQPNAFQNNAFQVDPVTGAIYAVDQNDSCSISAQVVISGSISATDQNDSCDITGTVSQPSAIDTHDGFTPEEVKRWKKLQKKLAQLEAKKRQALLDKRTKRRKQLEDIVSPPVAQIQQPIVESLEEVKEGKPPLDIKQVNAVIANLERQKQLLLKAVANRQEIARLQALIEAQQRAEAEDEETLLLLM
jgi:hypothetical protein